jgi:hypothetical protein
MDALTAIRNIELALASPVAFSPTIRECPFCHGNVPDRGMSDAYRKHGDECPFTTLFQYFAVHKS